MDIPQKDLEEFKRIFKEDYGEDLSDKEAYHLATKVLGLFRVITRPEKEHYPHG